jgi:hypothetical protein
LSIVALLIFDCVIVKCVPQLRRAPGAGHQQASPTSASARARSPTASAAPGHGVRERTRARAEARSDAAVPVGVDA